MEATLNVYAVPAQVTPEELAGGAVVVIDVLRASTTILHALEAGAAEIIPCQEVDDALAVAAKLPDDKAILGGERGGLRIDGFDLGNSPSEYTPDRVEGRTVVMTTTNGTRALLRCRLAARVLVGAFVNAAAVTERLVAEKRVHLLCAGTRGQFSRDDFLLAGLLAERLEQQGISCQLNVQAAAAKAEWEASFPPRSSAGFEPPDPEQLAEALRTSAGGRHLVTIGLEADILAAAQIDRFRTVPELDPKTFRIQRS